MVTPLTNTIHVGCQVEGIIGQLVDCPDQQLLPNEKRRRRQRQNSTGTVVEAVGPKRWKVQLDVNNKFIEIVASALQVIEASVAVPLDKVSFNIIIIF